MEKKKKREAKKIKSIDWQFADQGIVSLYIPLL
jgi:hypothetical protein